MKESEELKNLLEDENIVYKTGLPKWVLIWPPILLLISLIFFIVAISSGPTGYGSAVFFGLLF